MVNGKIYQNVALVLGGKSSEREVSLDSGEAIFKALKTKGYNVVKVDPLKDDLTKILKKDKVDIIFNALHGRYGEDGLIQGFLETVEIPYTGSSVVSSSLTMNKVFTKMILQLYDIPVIPFKYIRSIDKIEDIPFKVPVVIKPLNEGSSVGISLIDDEEQYIDTAKKTFEKYGSIVVEPYFKGKEVQVAVLNGKSIGAIEIKPKRKFYDYEAKYVTHDTEYIYPAEIKNETYRYLIDICEKIYSILECGGLIRVDFIVDQNGPHLLEVNTLPGMTSDSLVPKIAKAEGISFEQLCEEILLSGKLYKK